MCHHESINCVKKVFDLCLKLMLNLKLHLSKLSVLSLLERFLSHISLFRMARAITKGIKTGNEDTGRDKKCSGLL